MLGEISKAVAKAHEFLQAAQKAGFTVKLLEFFTHNHEAFCKLVEFAKTLLRPTYKVVLDCGKTIAQMLKEGEYDWMNEDITDEHFPVVGTEAGEGEITLFHFGKWMSSKNAIAEMAKEGYRPANATKLLALGKAQPDLQREFPIVALGQTWQYPRGNLMVVCLGEDDSKRRANLGFFDGDWHGDWRFAAVREEKLEA
ncbi:hypothetical protein HYV44_01060 [Candidatus Microgenomates bacterium]|nr:hypothetical protein [Candidatus Microgenomates bacterium]